MPILTPKNTLALAFAAVSFPEREAAAEKASEKYTGWKKAGTTRNSKRSWKLGAAAEAKLDKANKAIMPIMTYL
ncbi:hypothetical protein D3C73_1113640 [compost metagenome]|uniref:Uncharacterized protein n=1 Tax=Paenibacillus jilunlii TaxID=682956 RepID=A0A1G9JYH4_9BACL|nr:hypothetical protein SAMN05216191_10346 [Paenibacillus jilunlii]